MTVKVSLNENDRLFKVWMCYNTNILDCLGEIFWTPMPNITGKQGK